MDLDSSMGRLRAATSQTQALNTELQAVKNELAQTKGELERLTEGKLVNDRKLKVGMQFYLGYMRRTFYG